MQNNGVLDTVICHTIHAQTAAAFLRAETMKTVYFSHYRVNEACKLTPHISVNSCHSFQSDEEIPGSTQFF
jgi:hypothetical protein